VTEAQYRVETGCAALSDQRGDSLVATAPPAERWLLIESRTAWPHNALTALRTDRSSAGGSLAVGDECTSARGELGVEVARRCRQLGYRPAVIKRYGRVDRSIPRRWAVVDCRPGRESIRWGVLPSDEHVREVLNGADRGEASQEPIYLVCTHGRHDACCAVWGRPVAAVLAAAYPERTWECSHVGGDRFAANVVVLPHGLFYGHVPATRAVELAEQYDEGFVVPDLLRGSSAFSPPVQAAQHFARAAGKSLAVNALRPTAVRQPSTNRWQIDLATHQPEHTNKRAEQPMHQPEQVADLPEQAARQPEQATPGPGQVGGEVERGAVITVEVSAWLETVDARLTCSSAAPAHVRRFRLNNLTTN
jgi:hypothetical protein